jgi:hypothetical protein
MAVVNSRNFGMELCKVLNLDPKKTRTITIVSPVEDFVHVTVEQMLLEDEADKVIELIMKFKYIDDGEN